MNPVLILFFCCLFNYISSGKLSPCLAAQNCQYSGMSIPCSEHGVCFFDLFKFVKENSKDKNFIDCICDEGYLTETDDDEVKCCYEQKYQKYAVLLDLLPLGFGHYYTGRTMNFLVKLIFQSILLLCVIVCGFCQACKKKGKATYDMITLYKKEKNPNENPTKLKLSSSQLIMNAIYVLATFFLFVWQLMDIILFGLNLYTDENSIELKRW